MSKIYTVDYSTLINPSQSEKPNKDQYGQIQNQFINVNKVGTELYFGKASELLTFIKENPYTSFKTSLSVSLKHSMRAPLVSASLDYHTKKDIASGKSFKDSRAEDMLIDTIFIDLDIKDYTTLGSSISLAFSRVINIFAEAGYPISATYSTPSTLNKEGFPNYLGLRVILKLDSVYDSETVNKLIKAILHDVLVIEPTFGFDSNPNAYSIFNGATSQANAKERGITDLFYANDKVWLASYTIEKALVSEEARIEEANKVKAEQAKNSKVVVYRGKNPESEFTKYVNKAISENIIELGSFEGAKKIGNLMMKRAVAFYKLTDEDNVISLMHQTRWFSLRDNKENSANLLRGAHRYWLAQDLPGLTVSGANTYVRPENLHKLLYTDITKYPERFQKAISERVQSSEEIMITDEKGFLSKDALKNVLATHSHSFIQAPTGSGKSLGIRAILRRNTSVWGADDAEYYLFVLPFKTLVRQNAMAMEKGEKVGEEIDKKSCKHVVCSESSEGKAISAYRIATSKKCNYVGTYDKAEAFFQAIVEEYEGRALPKITLVIDEAHNIQTASSYRAGTLDKLTRIIKTEGVHTHLISATLTSEILQARIFEGFELVKFVQNETNRKKVTFEIVATDNITASILSRIEQEEAEGKRTLTIHNNTQHARKIEDALKEVGITSVTVCNSKTEEEEDSKEISSNGFLTSKHTIATAKLQEGVDLRNEEEHTILTSLHDLTAIVQMAGRFREQKTQHIVIFVKHDSHLESEGFVANTDLLSAKLNGILDKMAVSVSGLLESNAIKFDTFKKSPLAMEFSNILPHLFENEDGEIEVKTTSVMSAVHQTICALYSVIPAFLINELVEGGWELVGKSQVVEVTCKERLTKSSARTTSSQRKLGAEFLNTTWNTISSEIGLNMNTLVTARNSSSGCNEMEISAMSSGCNDIVIPEEFLRAIDLDNADLSDDELDSYRRYDRALYAGKNTIEALRRMVDKKTIKSISEAPVSEEEEEEGTYSEIKNADELMGVKEILKVVDKTARSNSTVDYWMGAIPLLKEGNVKLFKNLTHKNNRSFYLVAREYLRANDNKFSSLNAFKLTTILAQAVVGEDEAKKVARAVTNITMELSAAGLRERITAFFPIIETSRKKITVEGKRKDYTEWVIDTDMLDMMLATAPYTDVNEDVEAEMLESIEGDLVNPAIKTEEEVVAETIREAKQKRANELIKLRDRSKGDVK